LLFDQSKLNNKRYYKRVYEAQLIEIINHPEFTKTTPIASFNGFEYKPITSFFSNNEFLFFYYTRVIQYELLSIP